MKKLYKSETDQVITGIIGGLGEYFSIDPTIIRIVFVVIVLVSGIFPGVIAYILAYFIIPERPHEISTIITPPPMERPEPPLPTIITDTTPTSGTTKPEDPTTTI